MFKCLFASNKKSKRSKSVCAPVHNRDDKKVHPKLTPKIAINNINSSSKGARDGDLDSTRGGSGLDTRSSVMSPSSCFSTMAEARLDSFNLPADTKMIDDHINHLLKRQKVWSIQEPLNNHDISHKMRAKIVDWMGQVVHQYKLSCQTFFLSVRYMDTYLYMQKKTQKPLDLSLAGLACLFMASKFEDIDYLKMKTVVEKLGNQQFTQEQISDKEREILFFFGFNISIPTVYEFMVNIIGRVTNETKKSDENKIIEGAIYFAKLTTYHPSFSTMKRSKLAEALSFVALKKAVASSKAEIVPNWSDKFWAVCKHPKEEVFNIVLEVESLRSETSSQYTKLKMYRDTTSDDTLTAMK